MLKTKLQSASLALSFWLFAVLGCAERSAEDASDVAEAKSPPVPLDMASEITHKFDCGDGGMLGMRYVGPDTIEVTVADQSFVMPRVRSASGARFSKDAVTFWMKGDEAMLETESGKATCLRLAEIE